MNLPRRGPIAIEAGNGVGYLEQRSAILSASSKRLMDNAGAQTWERTIVSFRPEIRRDYQRRMSLTKGLHANGAKYCG